jgi:hypothetical protein
MFALLKGMVAAIIIVLVVSILVHRISGGAGGVLAIHQVSLLDVQISWSWPLFLIATAFCGALFKMME